MKLWSVELVFSFSSSNAISEIVIWYLYAHVYMKDGSKINLQIGKHHRYNPEVLGISAEIDFIIIFSDGL